MQLLVFTSPEFLQDEASLIESAFQAGADRLHLRKPYAQKEQLSALIARIDPQWYNRIVLHEHFELVEHYGLGGIHLNRRNPVAPDWAWNSARYTVSCSCHSLAELTDTRHLSYRTLSPIFDSLSKQGYASSFSESELRMASLNGQIDIRTIALGGVTPVNLLLLKTLVFGGAAVLGYVWQDFPLTPETVALRIANLKQNMLCCNL